MPTKEYLSALVNLMKHMITDKDKHKARGHAGGSRGPRGVDAEHMMGAARITPRTCRAMTDEKLFDLHEEMHRLSYASKKDIYKNAHKFVADEMGIRNLGHELEEHEFLDPGDVHVNQIMPEIVDNEITMPFPNEHACRIAAPGQFSRFRRNNSTSPHTIIGFSKDGKSKLASFRYPKGSYDEEAARKHCQSHGGSFEAAREN